MLFRPGAQDRLHSIQAQLAQWSEEADRFRLAAIAARRGEPQLDTLVSAAEETHDALMQLLEELDRTLDGLRPGHADFTAVLNVQNKVLALLESVGNSLDVLVSVVPDGRTDEVVISRKPLLAAE